MYSKFYVHCAVGYNKTAWALSEWMIFAVIEGITQE